MVPKPSHLCMDWVESGMILQSGIIFSLYKMQNEFYSEKDWHYVVISL